MTNDSVPINGHGPQADSSGGSTNFTVKTGLAQMLKGGVIMDVVNAEQVPVILPITVCAIVTDQHALS